MSLIIKLKIDFDRSALNESWMKKHVHSHVHMILTLVTLSGQKRHCFASSLLSNYGLEDILYVL